MKLRSLMTAICVLATANVVSAAPFAYVANSGTTPRTMSVIDTATNVVNPAVNLPNGYPACVAVGASGQTVYVGLQDTNSVAIFDVALNQVTNTIFLGTGIQPGGLAVNAAETRLYVTDANSNTLMVIDITNSASLLTNVAVDTSPTSNPQGVVLSPDGTKAYVANMSTGTVAVVSIDETKNSYTKTAQITVGAQPIDLSISSDGSKVYVSSLSGAVTVIDAASNNATTSLTVGSGTATLAVASNKVYAPSNTNAKLYVIDPTTIPSPTVLGTQYTTGTAPFGSAVTGSKLYLTLSPTSGTGSVEVYDTATLVEPPTKTVLSLPAGSKPSAIGNFIGPVFPYTITATASGNCSVSPPGTIAANSYGRKFTISQSLTATCDVKVNNVSVGQPTAYKFENISANQTIDASEITTGTYFTLSGDWLTNVGACVTSTPNGINCASKSAKFPAGSTVTLKAIPGYSVKNGTWGGACAGQGATCTLTNIAADLSYGTTVQFVVGGTGPIYNVTKSGYASLWSEAMSSASANDYIKVTTDITSLTTDGTAGLMVRMGNQWLQSSIDTKGTYTPMTLTITNVGVTVEPTDSLVL